MEKPAFEVFPFDLDRLIELIAEASFRKSPEEIKSKQHIAYFQSYLPSIGARTMLVERRYIDRDFLEDYAAYYVRCFQPYDRECNRIHFFSEAFTTADFGACISGGPSKLSPANLQDAYLGFVVVKPLPTTVIGRTCLKTYPETSQRCFPPTRKFDAHLFGISLSVERTLPFQEQDKIVAACATSALWTVFQSTARHFVHQIRTPIEITKAATHLFSAENRILPNRGLSTLMMSHAIKSVGLEPLLIDASEQHVLQAAIYSYVRAKVPLILNVKLVDDHGNGAGSLLDRHALAVVGYSLRTERVELPGSGLKLRASRIDKIYVHDDQIGPFARMELDAFEIGVKEFSSAFSLRTSWRSEAPNGKVRAVPYMLIVPLYHKVRIGWDWVHDVVTAFDKTISDLSSKAGVANLAGLEWDVFLSDVNEIKSDIFTKTSIDSETRKSILERPMPRFVWRAIARRDESEVAEILFDATDIETGDGIVHVLMHDRTALGALKQLTKDARFETSGIGDDAKKVLRWIRDH